MKHIEFFPDGVCSKKISFDIDKNNHIHNLKFKGGCDGNLKAIAKILEDFDANTAVKLLTGMPVDEEILVALINWHKQSRRI